MNWFDENGNITECYVEDVLSRYAWWGDWWYNVITLFIAMWMS